eukprot:SAG31_NODE_630_length_13427_cov_27.066327_14_plen_77_part_00
MYSCTRRRSHVVDVLPVQLRAVDLNLAVVQSNLTRGMLESPNLHCVLNLVPVGVRYHCEGALVQLLTIPKFTTGAV